MKTTEKRIAMIPLSSIVADEVQPRRNFDAVKLKSLMDSIQKHGIIDPLLVQEISKGKYLLVNGERRYRASTQLKLKEVPAIIEAPTNEVDRLIRQFHVQEQHEAWSPVEKAMAIGKSAKLMGVSIHDACRLLAIPDSDARRYAAFDKIIDKAAWLKNEVPIGFTQSMNSLKGVARRVSKEELEKEFTVADEKKLEHRVIAAIKDGSIKERSDVSQIQDAFVAKPKSITEFMASDVSPAELYLKSKAKGAFFLRRTTNHAGWITTYANRYLTIQDTEPTKTQMEIFERAHAALGTLLKAVK